MKIYPLLVTSVLLAGCSNAPSSSDIEKALEASVDSCKNVEIVDVKKTNGFQEDGFYHVEYTAAVEIKEKADLKKLYETWRDEYEEYKAKQQAYEEFEARIGQLQKEARELSTSVGKEPEQRDFDHLQQDFQRFDAYNAAKMAWRQRGDEAAKPKLEEIERLRQEWLQQPKPNFVVIGHESEVTTNFFYKGCPHQAMAYVSAAIPEMTRDSNGMLNPETRLSFARADLKGEMKMRKTENGWQKI